MADQGGADLGALAARPRRLDPSNWLAALALSIVMSLAIVALAWVAANSGCGPKDEGCYPEHTEWLWLLAIPMAVIAVAPIAAILRKRTRARVALGFAAALAGGSVLTWLTVATVDFASSGNVGALPYLLQTAVPASAIPCIPALGLGLLAHRFLGGDCGKPWRAVVIGGLIGMFLPTLLLLAVSVTDLFAFGRGGGEAFLRDFVPLLLLDVFAGAIGCLSGLTFWLVAARPPKSPAPDGYDPRHPPVS